jgi:Holliday junction resolvasome RuvABC endonuclease subunit
VKFLALDQSLSSTGWAIFDNKTLIAANLFTISKTAPMERRLLEIYKNLTDLYHEYEFEKIYFEDIQLQAGNALTYKHLAYAQAAIILWCGHMNMDWSMSAPSHWRKVLGGGFGRKRAEQKRYAIQLVQKWYNIEVSSDIADAICIGRAAIQESREKKAAFDES